MKNLIKISLVFVFLACILAGYANAQTDESSWENLGCIVRLSESPKVIIIGVSSSETGCQFNQVLVDSRYFRRDDATLSKIALDALGWKKARKKERERLAKLWVEKGLLAFSTVLYAKDQDLSGPDFQPPQVVSGKNGEIRVALWIQLPSGMTSRKPAFQRLEFKFNKDGNLRPPPPIK